jgi:hypothetical protein
MKQAATYLLRRECSQPGPLEAAIVEPQFCVCRIDAAIAGDGIVYGDNRFSFFLEEALTFDAIVPLLFSPLLRNKLFPLPLGIAYGAPRIVAYRHGTSSFEESPE